MMICFCVLLKNSSSPPLNHTLTVKRSSTEMPIQYFKIPIGQILILIVATVVNRFHFAHQRNERFISQKLLLTDGIGLLPNRPNLSFPDSAVMCGTKRIRRPINAFLRKKIVYLCAIPILYFFTQFTRATLEVSSIIEFNLNY